MVVGRGIKAWSNDDRPREKLVEKGTSSLSDAELLALIIGSGSRNQTAVELARSILDSVNQDWNALGRLTINELSRFKGMGEAKSVNVLAALEISRRRKKTDAVVANKISSSYDAYSLLSPHMSDLVHEEFWVVCLTRAHKIISLKKISEGGWTSTVADPKKIFSLAIDQRASAIIVAHNHPSDNLIPSIEDKNITRRLRRCGLDMDLPLLDHLIVGPSGYFSFADEGILNTE